jgi:hypothetical protein
MHPKRVARMQATIKAGAIVALSLRFLDRECHFKCRVRYRASALAAASRLAQTAVVAPNIPVDVAIKWAAPCLALGWSRSIER